MSQTFVLEQIIVAEEGDGWGFVLPLVPEL